MFVLDEILHYPINWVDGMRVSKDELEATDKAWSDALRDVRATILQGNQYGLLPAIRDNKDTSDYPKFSLDSAKRILVLEECRAITRGGYRIEIVENVKRKFEIPLHFPKDDIKKEEDFSVYITVDMFNPEGAGKMSTNAPPRHLHVSPLYELSIISESEGVGLSGFNHLKIAEYKFKRGEFILNKEYIPPCMTINSHNKLQERFHKAGNNLKSIHDNGIILCQSYRLDKRPDVSDAVKWVEHIVTLIARSIWGYFDLLSQRSPIETIAYFKNLCQSVLSLSDIYSNNPFLKKGIQTELRYLNAIADPKFSADDLQTAFLRIDEALQSLHLWFKSLNEAFRQARPISVKEVK